MLASHVSTQQSWLFLTQLLLGQLGEQVTALEPVLPTQVALWPTQEARRSCRCLPWACRSSCNHLGCWWFYSCLFNSAF